MTKSVYIVCAGGHAKQVCDVFISRGYDVKGAFDDKKTGIFYRNIPVIGTMSDFYNYESKQNQSFFCTLGDCMTRKNICERRTDLIWINCISPYSYISETAIMGYGNYIGVHSKILSDSRIGNFNIINDGSTVTHDNIIGNYNHIAPNASLGGNVSIGDLNLIGTNATINPTVKIDNNIIIGSNCMVNKNLTISGTYIGVPCKLINK
jgi:sugar O-acyltransferase (sialic acid O-acetyltransferase NeuD family)